MKISYNSYPALIYADKSKRDMVLLGAKMAFALKKRDPNMSKEDRNLLWTEEQLICGGIMLNKPIYFISDTFLTAVEQNEAKLCDLVNNNWEMVRDGAEDCIMVTRHKHLFLQHRLDDNRILFVSQHIEGTTRHCLEYRLNDGGFNVIFTMDLNEAMSQTRMMMKIIMFKKYATVELETIKAGKKKEVKNVERGKVINEMGIDVTMLDSTWFREIIRNEGFKVRGHFRLQPCKDDNGEWTRKIIYIEEFEKHGYHRRAKMDIEKEAIEQ